MGAQGQFYDNLKEKALGRQAVKSSCCPEEKEGKKENAMLFKLA